MRWGEQWAQSEVGMALGARLASAGSAEVGRDLAWALLFHGTPLAAAEWSRETACGLWALVSAHCSVHASWHTQVQRQHFKGTFINSCKYRYLGIRNSNVRLEVLLDIAHKILNSITWPDGHLYLCHFIRQHRSALMGVSYIYTLPKSSFVLVNWCKLASE